MWGGLLPRSPVASEGPTVPSPSSPKPLTSTTLRLGVPCRLDDDLPVERKGVFVNRGRESSLFYEFFLTYVYFGRTTTRTGRSVGEDVEISVLKRRQDRGHPQRLWEDG